MAVSERRAAGCDGLGNTGPVQADHIGIALTDYDRGPSPQLHPWPS